MTEYTDRQGRTTADRITLVHRYGDPTTQEERDRARGLLDSLLEAADRHGVTLEDFDWTIDLPGGCLDVVRAKRRDT